MELLIVLISFIVLIFSVILHEIMHGFVAEKLGDNTARIAGRLTLNPIPHIDPIMSILVPALLIISGSPILFGAAKPVPINPHNFKDFMKDMALTALAGPATNIALVLIAAAVYHLGIQSPIFNIILLIIIETNISLAILNLLPIPPIDGSKVLLAFLPTEIGIRYISLQRYGMFILLFLLWIPIGGIDLGTMMRFLEQKALLLLRIP